MKRLVIVLGMHRSGTSLTARISQCMGAYLGEESELMGAALGNSDGHFENIEVVRINDSILQSCGKEWYSLDLPKLDYSSLKIKKAIEDIKGVVRKLLEKKDLAVIKDPRISILLPLWEKTLKELGIQTDYIWVFRNPLEVIESLRKRDGYSSRHSLLLWIHYNLNILKFLQGKDYLLINYRDILLQSQAINELCVMYNCKFDENLKWELNHIIKLDYCHSDYSFQDISNVSNELLSEIYRVLLEKKELEADIQKWEKYYEAEIAEIEDTFIDYDVLEDISHLYEKEIVIYGAGNYGRQAAEMLQKLNISKYSFCDRDIGKQGTKLLSGRIFSIKELEERNHLLFIIAIDSEKGRAEIEQTLTCIKGIQFLSFFVLEMIGKYFIENTETLLVKAERISAWYKVLESRANILKNACEKSILVYQNGKVGSSTVSRSLRNAGVENAHVHRFFFSRDIVGELVLGEEKKEIIDESNLLKLGHSDYVKAVKDDMKNKKIITMVREPISVDLSTVFQWIGTGIAYRYIAKRVKDGKIFQQIVSELVMKIQNRLFDWFDEELRELCGIDVYSYPFDKEKGYTIISKNETEVLILKAEKLSSLTDVIRDFVGNQNLELTDENVGRNKKYAHLYQKVKKNIMLPREYVEYYYNNNACMDHFYTKEEQKSFLDKWKGHIIEENAEL